MRTLAVMLAVIACAVVSATCTGHIPPPPPPEYLLPPPDYPYHGKRGEMLVPRDGCFRYYFPYVEEAALPIGVKEGDASAIELRISAEYRPVILRGYTDNEYSGVFYDEYQYELELPDSEFAVMRRAFFDGKHEFEINLELTITEPPGEGEPLEKFTYHLPPLPAGTYLVRVFAAQERQWGGIGWYGAHPGEVPESFRPEGDPLSWLNHLDGTEHSFEIEPTRGLE